MTRPNLDEIARHTQPGKSVSELGYTAVYDLLLRDRRDQVKTVLEIGVLKGASLRMWEEYFSTAKVYGIDLHTYPGLPDGKFTDRAQVFLADQSKPEELLEVMKRINAPLDFVSDDGSHKTADQITSLRTLFPFLADGGLYVIEDIEKMSDIEPHLKGFNYWFAIPHTIGHEHDGTILAIIQK